MSAYPHRLRLHGGRTTHAARAAETALGHTVLTAACGRTSSVTDELLADDAPITCRACTRAAATEETAR